MIIKNKLDIAFGPFGSSTGFFLFLGGILATFYSVFGLILVVVGAFTAFTTTSCQIDTEKRRLRHANNLFGVLPVGKWIEITSEMKLGLGKSHLGYQAYIRGTQPVGIHYNDIRIFLYDAENKQIMPIQKFKTYDSSVTMLESLSSLLGLKLI
jgi:hypothetical protein